MKNETLFKIIIPTAILVFILVYSLFFYKNDELKFKEVKPEEPTYYQGLWDGFNGTVKYFEDKGYLKDTTINIEITELEKYLEKKNKERLEENE